MKVKLSNISCNSSKQLMLPDKICQKAPDVVPDRKKRRTNRVNKAAID